jgi:serine/threonine protein kinase
MALSNDQFLNQVVASELLAQQDISAVINAIPEDRRPKDGEQLARELVRQKKLTKYQAEQIYSGKGKTLILGNYVVLDKLGQGGMGVVLKAEHKRLKRLVALKVMSSSLVKTPDALKRFHREVEAAAKLRHTNVVATDDADEAKGTHFLVMEYVEGSDLSALVRKNGPLSVSQAVQCILQAARGLEYAHKQGVVHRDIKPANLLLDTSGTVKILDMGLARIEGDSGSQGELTSTGAVMGTVDYMAPEQAMSTKHADARSDIYSLGISLWYLLAGRCAYEGDSLMAKLLAHRDAQIPSLCVVDSEIPAALDAVFRKMVAKQAKDRYQSMTEVIRDLESCRTGSQSTPDVAAPNNFEDPSLQSFLSQLGGSPSSLTTPPATRKSTEPATRVKINPAAEATMLNGSIGVDTDPQTMTRIRKQEREARRGNRAVEVQTASPPWYLDKRILFGGAAAAALILAAVVILMRTPHGTLRVEILDPDVEMKVKGTEVTFRATDIEPVSLVTGDKKLIVTRGDLSFETEVFALKKGEETRIKVELIGDQLIVNEGDNKIGQKLIAGNVLNSSTTGAAMNSPAAPEVSAESPPLKPAETSPAVAAAKNSIDLLALVDLQRDVGVGNWKKVADGISCENAAGASVLQLPYEPAEEYDFEVEFTTTGTGLNVNQYVSAGGKIFAWKLNSHNVDPPLYGFELLDGKFAKDNKEAAVQIPESIVVGQRYRSTVEVRRGGLRTLLDGKELVKWSGDFSRFSTETVTPMKHPGRIGIGSWRRPVTFHSVKVREVSGRGRNMAIASPDSGDHSGWQSLFNGKDLTGWKVIGVDGWTVKSGILTGNTSQQNGNGWLMSEAEFSDYELELEYKLSTGSNSGLFPRAFPTGDVSGKDFVEIQLLDDNDPGFVSVPADRKTGSIFGRFAPQPTPMVPPNQWHRLKMVVRGQNLSLEINDVVVVKQGLTDLPLNGHIGLQLYPTQIEFRNLRIRH